MGGFFHCEEYVRREQIIAAIQKCARKLGRRPTRRELERMGIPKTRLRLMFGSHKKAMMEAGFEARGKGFSPAVRELLESWAGVARKLGKVPVDAEYGRHGKFSRNTYVKRFDTWKNVPGAMKTHILKSGVEAQYRDVLKMIAQHQKEMRKRAKRPVWKPVRWPDRPVYGPPMFPGALHTQPTTEGGVMVLFGAVAGDLGFSILKVQTAFPDCEALCEVERGKCQIARIEFELFSRNFKDHRHNPRGCDLIVCWEHNWPECPVPVLELKVEVRRLMAGKKHAQKH